MHKFLQNFDKYLKIYFLLSVILLALFTVLLYKKVNQILKILPANIPTGTVETPASEGASNWLDSCGVACKKEIAKVVAEAISTLSAKPKTTSTPAPQPPPAPTSTQKQTAFIPLSGPITTTSLDWTDAAGTDFYLDLANDYGKGATVSWDAFLSVANSNGQAFARIYDVTHAIAVNGSEVSVSNTATATQASSGNLSFWSGRNLYRVQIKSLNSFVVTFSSGRVKIIY